MTNVTLLAKKLRNLAGYNTVHGATESEAGMLNTAAFELERLHARVEDMEHDIDNAVRQAKEQQPEYPWQDGHPKPASEAAWATCSALEGTGQAIDEHWVPLVNVLRDALQEIATMRATGTASERMKDVAKKALREG